MRSESRVQNGDNPTRNMTLDVLRGAAIVDMILVHSRGYLPSLAAGVVSHQDIAMEGFLLLTGFVIGNIYLPRYRKNPQEVSGRLLERAWKIFAIQLAMVFSVSLVHYLVTAHPSQEQLMSFLFRSTFLLNQVGLMHILPTFIPLFLISPLLLLLLSRNLGPLVVALSTALFAWSFFNPGACGFGDPAIFPVCSWQLFFCVGACLGQIAAGRQNGVTGVARWKLMIAAGTLLVLAMVTHHGQAIGRLAGHTIGSPFLEFGRFPLTFSGAIHGLAAWSFLAACLLLVGERSLRDSRAADVLAVLGRRSLLVFVTHLYLAKALAILAALYGAERMLVPGIILVCGHLAICVVVIRKFERGGLPRPVRAAIAWI